VRSSSATLRAILKVDRALIAVGGNLLPSSSRWPSFWACSEWPGSTEKPSFSKGHSQTLPHRWHWFRAVRPDRFEEKARAAVGLVQISITVEMVFISSSQSVWMFNTNEVERSHLLIRAENIRRAMVATQSGICAGSVSTSSRSERRHFCMRENEIRSRQPLGRPQKNARV